jgi:hypothetical protein
LIRPSVFAPLLVGLAIAVSAWFANRGLPTNDEGAVLTLAAKILRGGVFYRDLDAYYFPGAAYLLAGWMRLVGEDVNAARWLAAGVFSCLVLGLYLTAVQLLDRRRAAIFGIGLLSFKLLAAPAFTAFMYGDLSLCFAASSIALLVRHPYRGASLGLVVAGVLVACATASKQNVGIYVTGAGMLLLTFSPKLLGAPDSGFRRRLPELAAFTLGLALAAVPMLGYFLAKGLLPDLIASGVVRPFLQYLPTSGISFAEPLAWWNLGDLRGMSGFPFFVGPYWSMLMNSQLPGEALYPAYWIAGEIFSRALYTSIPAVFLLVFWRWGRAIRARKFSVRERRVFAFAFLALAVVLSAFPRADLFHVMNVYPVVFLLLFGLGRPANGDSGARESNARAPWISACSVALLLAATGSLTIVHQELRTYRMQITRADLYIEPAKSWVESVVKYVESTLEPDEPLFVYGHEAYYYFFTGHHTAWPFVQLYPGQVGGNRGVPLVRFLKRTPPSLIVRGLLEWPGVPGIPTYAAALNQFAIRNYDAYEDFFEHHPPPVGVAPPAWSVAVLHRRDRIQPSSTQ